MNLGELFFLFIISAILGLINVIIFTKLFYKLKSYSLFYGGDIFYLIFYIVMVFCRTYRKIKTYTDILTFGYNYKFFR